MKGKPDVICRQETWLEQSLEFIIKSYTSVRRDRVVENGGACSRFVKRGFQYRELKKENEKWEDIAIEVWTNVGKMKIRQLEL